MYTINPPSAAAAATPSNARILNTAQRPYVIRIFINKCVRLRTSINDDFLYNYCFVGGCSRKISKNAKRNTAYRY